jgi:hypothetical protein
MTAMPEEAPGTKGTPDQQRLRRGRKPADTFSNRLMLARALAGHVSIREACEITGLNRGNWTGWERGLRPRDILDVCQRVAAGLDIDEEWLLWGGPLAGPMGVPVTREPDVRAEEFRQAYSPRAERPADTRPKVRVDRTHPPAGPAVGRRPVRVGTGRFADHAAVVINHG